LLLCILRILWPSCIELTRRMTSLRSAFVALLTVLSSTMALAASSTLAYVGTYTGGKSRGIYAFRVETAAGRDPQFVPLGLAAEAANPAFLAIDEARRLVFAVNETDSFNGEKTGAVSAFSADPATGKLTLINQQPSHGTHPCHLMLDPSGKFLVVANYTSGSVAVFPVAADGRLGAATAVVQHSGHSIDPQRQEGPHAHAVTFDPAGRFVFICDLGLDRIAAYRLDADSGKLAPVSSAGATVPPGGGPRHLAFGSDGKFAYALNELNATVTALGYDAGSGRMTEIQTLSALPAGFTGRKSAAEIAVHPSGKWLYTSNRGHDSIALFAIDPAKGALTFEATQASDGKTPRHFALLPGGQHLVVANQETGTLRLCRIDQATGRLQPVGEQIAVPKPVCVGFLTVK
jgi:6-phosphogluconolactonase